MTRQSIGVASTMRNIVVVAVLAYLIYHLSKGINEVFEDRRVKGFNGEKFDRLKHLFADLSKYERGGVSLAVLNKGKIVVDLWSGFQDPTANIEWRNTTLVNAFSTTKIYIGIIFTLLQHRQGFSFTDKVSTFWPEFGANGKENITIQDVLDHKAGILQFARDFTLHESKDLELMSHLIEQTTPQWTPGTKVGYCGISYGFVIDQLVRRLDAKKRTSAQFFREEIRPLSKDQDFFIGLPSTENYRVARISNPSFVQSAVAHLSRPHEYIHILNNFFSNGMVAQASASYPEFLDLMRPDFIPYNSPDIRELPIISVMGIGTARAMAHTLHAAGKLISMDDKEIMSVPRSYEEDFILSTHKAYGRGFTHIPHPLGESRHIIQFIGNGGQTLAWDAEKDIIFVLFRNGLLAGANKREEMREMVIEAFRGVHNSE